MEPKFETLWVNTEFLKNEIARSCWEELDPIRQPRPWDSPHDENFSPWTPSPRCFKFADSRSVQVFKGSRSAAQHPTLLTEVILESINWKNRFTGTLRFFHLKKLDLPDRNPSDRSNIFIDIYGGKFQPVETQSGILKNGQDGLILRSAKLLWSLQLDKLVRLLEIKK